MIMKSKLGNVKLFKLIIVIVIVIGIGIYINNNYIIKWKQVDLSGQQYGVIDDGICNKYSSIICLNPSDEGDYAHGDEVCRFINDNYYNYKILYYNANYGGKISTESIIDGLDELKEYGVNRINISLSSKVYSTQLQEWIDNNPDIIVYASYNNKVNTFDYPAMYENVIASGEKNSKIEFKKNDIKYKSKKIISIRNKQLYNGNSYLSLISMFEI